MDKVLKDILFQADKTETGKSINVIIHYQDLIGDSFFEKIDSLKLLFSSLEKKYNLILMEDVVSQCKYWEWKLPIYFDDKYKFIQFDLKKTESKIDSLNSRIECGSIWKRSSDKTVIEIQAIEKFKVYVKSLSGPGIQDGFLNKNILQTFWNRTEI